MQREIARRKAAANGKIGNTEKRLMTLGGMFTSERQIATELTAGGGDDGGVAKLTRELDTVVARAERLIGHTDRDDVNAVEKTASALDESLAEAERLAAEIGARSAQNETALRGRLHKALDRGFSASFADVGEKPRTSVRKKSNGATPQRRETAERRLRVLDGREGLPHTYHEQIGTALARLGEITDEEFLGNYISITVEPLVRKAERTLAEYEACREEFERLYTEYTALCGLYGYVAQAYPCTRESIATLTDELRRIETEAGKNDEMAYISECMDEVMREMGYAVLGSREVTKRNGRSFHSDLYSYGEGTAVNVTCSSDGRIAMELGGMDTEDRGPTAQETAALCDSMTAFCDDFKEIERRLAKRGVVLADRVSLLPPDAAYAQIINTSDYDMKAETASVRTRKKQRPVNGKKVMRRE